MKRISTLLIALLFYISNGYAQANCAQINTFSLTTTGTGPYTHNISLTVSSQGGSTKNALAFVKCNGVNLTGFENGVCIQSSATPYTYTVVNDCSGPLTLEYVGYTGNNCGSGNECFCSLPTGGTTSGPAVVCAGSNATLQLTGQKGNIQWQKKLSTDPETSYANISGGNGGTLVDNPGSAGNTYAYRACLSPISPGCPSGSNQVVYSTETSVSVNGVTSSTIISDQTICTGSDPAGFLETTAATGTAPPSHQWQSGTSGCAGSFSNISGATSPTYDPPAGLNVTTYYRVIATSTVNGVSCTASSNCLTVSVDEPSAAENINFSGTSPVCTYGPPTNYGSVSPATYTATDFQWQRGDENSQNFMDISGATSSSYTLPNSTTTGTYTYRVLATNGTCPSVFSTPSSLIVIEPVYALDGVTVLVPPSGNGDDATIQLSSNTLPSGTYSVLYHFSAPAVDDGTPKSMSFTSGSPGTGVFVTGPITGFNGNTVIIIDELTKGTCTALIGGAQAPLPVDLISFKTKLVNKTVELAWATASEFNNEKFVIERSNDGMRYTGIGEVSGHGTTIEQHNYLFKDESPEPGINYYRLQQRDFDGQFEYSNVEVVMMHNEDEITVYPTITSGSIRLELPNDAQEETLVSIYNMQGALIHQQEYEGSNSYHVTLSQIPDGQYIVAVINKSISSQIMIFKQ